MVLRQLESFQIVMMTLNMTTAANELHLTPAAVSLQIRRLRNEVGAELFTRVGRNLVPTQAAKRLQRDLVPLMNALKAIREDFPPETKKEDTRPFVLASGIGTLLYQLRQPLTELRRKFPVNDIEVRIGATDTIIRGLESKQIDLGFVALPLEAPAIQLDPLFREELVFLTSASTPKTFRKIVSVQDLSNCPMILYQSGATRALIDRMAARNGLSLLVRMEVDDTESIKKLVEAGFGFSILPANTLSNCSGIRTFRIREERLFRDIALATALSAYPRKLTAEIIEFFKGTRDPRRRR